CHESVPTVATDVSSSRRREWIVGTGKRDAVDGDKSQSITRDVHPLPQGQGAERTRSRILDELLNKSRKCRLALDQYGDFVPKPLPHFFGCGLGCTAR